MGFWRNSEEQFLWWLLRLSVCLQCVRPEFDPWVGKIPWRRKWQPTPVFLPGKFHGWRSLVDYSPWDCKESDMTEHLHLLTYKDERWQAGLGIPLKVKSVSHSVTSDSFVTPWIVTRQAPLSMGFLRQEYWSGLWFSSPEDFPNPGIKPRSPALQADSLLSEPPGEPGDSLGPC